MQFYPRLSPSDEQHLATRRVRASETEQEMSVVLGSAVVHRCNLRPQASVLYSSCLSTDLFVTFAIFAPLTTLACVCVRERGALISCDVDVGHTRGINADGAVHVVSPCALGN